MVADAAILRRAAPVEEGAAILGRPARLRFLALFTAVPGAAGRRAVQTRAPPAPSIREPATACGRKPASRRHPFRVSAATSAPCALPLPFQRRPPEQTGG